MSRNYYSEIHLHVVWHAKQSDPMLTPEIERLVHRELRQKIVNWPGVFVHEINGTATHVHLVVSIAPTITISEFIGQLKGASSHAVNEQAGRKEIEWQTGYGVVSFGAKDLDWVREYVRRQKEHHANKTVFDRLERITSDDAHAETARSPVNGAGVERSITGSPAVNGGPNTAARKAP
jgi:putative transposase